MAVDILDYSWTIGSNSFEDTLNGVVQEPHIVGSPSDIAYKDLQPMLRRHQVEAIFVGSSSDGYQARERATTVAPVAQTLARRLGLSDGVQFSNACAASSSAIGAAMSAISAGRFNVVVAGGIDKVTLSTEAAFESCRLLGDRCYPFAEGRKHVALSEGSAWVVLARPGYVGLPAAGVLSGFGAVCGAAEVAGITEEPISRAISRAKPRPSFIPSFVMSHGTGTQANDLAEARSVCASFSKPPPIVSYKRWLGHPQGASGAVGLAMALESMRAGRLIPTAGHIDEIDYGRLPTMAVVTHPSFRPEYPTLNSAMVLSHGTWDICTALTVEVAR